MRGPGLFMPALSRRSSKGSGNMASKTTIVETAYAKINLGLQIIGLREDGYHEVSLIMQSVGLTDEITLQNGDNGLELTCDLPGLSCGPDNLVCQAATLVAAEAGRKPDLRIRLRKNIFLGAGLAGGSTDAAAVLRGLNKLWDLHLDPDIMKSLAARLGSDVPFCLEGGTALATGRGEIIDHLKDLPTAHVVLARPKGLSISTGWAYKNFRSGRVINHPKIWAIVDRLRFGAPALVPYMANELETVTIPAYPLIAQIKAAMVGAGAYFAMMSGSGPTVFALAADKKQAEAAAAALRDFDVDIAVTTTVGRRQG